MSRLLLETGQNALNLFAQRSEIFPQAVFKFFSTAEIIFQISEATPVVRLLIRVLNAFGFY